MFRSPFVTAKGDVVQRRQIIDVPGRKEITVDGSTDSVVTYLLGKDTSFSSIGTGCQRIPNPKHSTLLGYDVVLLVRDNEKLHYEAWHAPSLRCLPLEETYSNRVFGKLEVKSTRKVTEVHLGEPAPALFEVPPNYVERSPAQVIVEMNRRYGLKLPIMSADSAPELKYWRNRRKDNQ